MPDSISLPELARLTGYSYEALIYRVGRGYIDHHRADDGTYRVPVTEVTKLARRQKYQRHPSA